MERSCPRQGILVPRVSRALGVPLGDARCHIVDMGGMQNVMTRAGWSRNETHGVVGFQLGRDIYVRQDAPWTVLHELIHRAGVNADRLNRYVAEGLTEAIALELKEDPAEHRPTYPDETRWVREVLLPKLKMGAVQLGSILARSSDPARTLAELLAKRDPAIDRGALSRQLAAQRPERPDIGGRGSVAGAGSRAVRLPSMSDSDGTVGALAAILLVSGASLGLPLLLSPSRGSR